MSNDETSARLNYLYNLAYQILNIMMPLATAPYVARVIGAEGVGIGSYYNTIASYFATIAMLGLTNYGSRTIAQSRNDQDVQNNIFSSLFYMQILLCLLMGCFYVAYIAFFVKTNTSMAWLYGISIAASLINLNWYFWGIEEFKITVTRSFIVKIITFISIFMFVKNEDDLLLYNGILVLGNFLGNIPLIIVLKNYVKFVRVTFKDIFKHCIPNLILFIPILGATLYRTMDKVMLGSLVGFSEVGCYENADKIINICLGCITALGQVMMPRASNLLASGKTEECYILIRKSFGFSTLFSSVIMFGLLSVSNVFVPIFFGKDFTGTSSILSILSISFLFLAWANVIKMQVVMARGKDSVYVESTIVGLIINLILNSVLIPFMQGNGAAIATMITEAIVFVYISTRIRMDISILGLIKQSLRYLIIGFIMMIIVIFVKQFLAVNIFSMLILIGLGATIFISGCLILAFVFKDSLMIEICDIIIEHLKKSR